MRSIIGGDRGGLAGSVSESAERHQNWVLGPFGLAVSLEQDYGVTPDGFAVGVVAFDLDRHPQREHRAQWGGADAVDAFVPASADMDQLKAVAAQEVEEKFFKPLRRPSVKSV
ncbi:hypothetical protein CCYS_10900 [Corynebacterium cystitidis DSM 20524]|uniref:Uncharacterized protein n=1 Tax=Corynebacterium cystitidis DSM 20524 TaxID=1121357 RepID=A0A1H9SKA3_9CORY|nr:hypothetical protein CCYS_10900 [Corynebacterium cystitidis DSM 20524]SER85460.1 hypothetical protein SAMN05661109_01158 [Corynebacterium cystitidis DSM 20524]SNV65970.1 Uncharacterised protein [Corynebacterium cystitidis]